MHPPAPSPRNRRLAPKGGTKVACFNGTMGLGANLALLLLDVSETGARLTVKACLELGQAVEVQLTAPGKGRPFKLAAVVTWSAPAGEQDWCLGVRFDKRLRYIDLMDLCR
jgi:hypothetical protein